MTRADWTRWTCVCNGRDHGETMLLLQAIVLIACPVFFALGAMTDILSYRIPNWIPGALVVLFAIAAPLAEMPLQAVGMHGLVFVVTLFLGMGLFALNLVGGGDAKFFAAISLWMGPAMIVKFVFAFALVGGAFAILLLIVRRIPAASVSAARVPVLNQLLMPKAGMPYGVALGLGGLIALPGTFLFLKAFAP